MPFREMKIKGAWIHEPIRHTDDRGYFEELFRTTEVSNLLGSEFIIRQGNKSVSKKGVIRGIHYTGTGEAEHKYVSCPRGSIVDFVVDLRVGSPTFGKWDSVILSQTNGSGVLISSGIGHAFLSVEDGSVAQYVTTLEYSREKTKVVDPFDDDILLNFDMFFKQFDIAEPIVSEQDLSGTKFSEVFGVENIK